MSDQALLSHLLRELKRAIRAHYAAVGVDIATAYQEVDKGEKRIFSLFAKLTKDLEAERRASVQNLAAFDALLKERDRPTAEPFDEAKARAGESVEAFIEGDWHDVGYIGKRQSGEHIFENAKFGVIGAHALKLRMKAKTQQVQMFANVFARGASNGQIGALYTTTDDANRATGTNTGYYTATAQPVTITVTL